MNSLSWGILGTGRIAGIFAKQLSESKTGRLAAVGSRSQANADKFAAQHHVPHAHGGYEALLADPDVQIVYIATPHTLHAEWCIKWWWQHRYLEPTAPRRQPSDWRGSYDGSKLN